MSDKNLKIIAEALEAHQKQLTNDAFQAGVERGRFEQRLLMRKEMDSVKADAEKDLTEMRRFQCMVIELTSRINKLEKENKKFVNALCLIVGLNFSAAYVPPHQPTAARAIELAREALKES